MESQPQNPEFRNNPENFHPCRRNRVSLWKWSIFIPQKADTMKKETQQHCLNSLFHLYFLLSLIFASYITTITV